MKFPTPEDQKRIEEYSKNNKLFDSDHFTAFNLTTTPGGNEAKARQKYIVCAFPQLISYIIAEYLFGEKPEIYINDEQGNLWVQELIRSTKFNQICYETAITSSKLGDGVFKIRTQNEDDKEEIIIEEMQPNIYFPKINPLNVKEEPTEINIGIVWTEIDPTTNKEKSYLLLEKHKKGEIVTEKYEYDKSKKQTIQLLEEGDPVKTDIDRLLIIHIPNGRIGNNYFGVSDYKAIESVLYAYNKRISKLDEVLDKHSSPILAVGEGVIGEDGKVKRRALDMIEIPEDTNGQMPQYITWDASLQSAYTHLQKLLDLLFINSEISPTTFARTEGSYPESGRSLMFHLLPTIRKRNRKRIYYDQAIKELIYTAQELAIKRKISINDIKPPTKAEYPTIEWKDGIINDVMEEITMEAKRVEAGLTTRKDSIMRLDGVDEETAKIKADEIKEEQGDFTSLMDTFNNQQ